MQGGNHQGDALARAWCHGERAWCYARAAYGAAMPSAPIPVVVTPARRVVLVGYRASGKTTVGPLLAERLAVPFIDADAILFERLGSIAAFFASHGEAAFRAHETAVLQELLASDAGLVVATGGGAVIRAENRELLAQARAHGVGVVYLHAPATVLQARLRADPGARPSLSGAPVADEVPTLLAAREPWYRAVADHVADATLPPAQVAASIAAFVPFT